MPSLLISIEIPNYPLKRWWTTCGTSLEFPSLSSVSGGRYIVQGGQRRSFVARPLSKTQAWSTTTSIVYPLFHFYQFVYVDESGSDKRGGYRRTRWSPRGVTPVQV